MVTRMREKGQVTIPQSIRESLSLDKDSILSISKVGDAILMTPGPSAVEDFSRKFQKAAKEAGFTLEDLLKDLREIRHGK